MQQPYVVALVVDPGLARLSDLAQTMHVCAVWQSDFNRGG